MKKPPLAATRKFRAKDPKVQRLHDRLHDYISPAAAAFLGSADELLSQSPPLPATTHLVAHCLREANALICEALDPGPKGEKHEDDELWLLVESARSAIEDIQIRLSKNPDSRPPERLAQELRELRAILTKIESFLFISRAGQANAIRRILESLEVPIADGAAVAWLTFPNSLQSKVHKTNSLAPEPVDGEIRETWMRFLEVLETVLDRFEPKIHRQLAKIDKLVTRATLSKDDRLVLSTLSGAPFLTRHLFEKLSHPEWVSYKEIRRRIERSARQIERDEQSVTAHSWPPATYLTRIAGDQPEQVLELLTKIDCGDNFRVAASIISVGCALPANRAEKLLQTVLKLIERPFSAWIQDEVLDFFDHLTTVETRAAAFLLIAKLLEVEAGDETAVVPSHIGDDTYDDLVSSRIDSLAHLFPGEVVNLLRQKLTEAIEILNRAIPKERVFLSHEEPSIERPGWEPYSPITSIGRGLDCSLQKLHLVSPDEHKTISKDLASSPIRIERQIGLIHAAKHPDLAQQLLNAHERLNDEPTDVEMARLANSQFRCLSRQEQTAFVNAILGQAVGRNVDERERWQLGWLSAIRDALDAENRTKYEELVRAYGELSAIRERYPRARWGNERANSLGEREMSALGPEKVWHYLSALPETAREETALVSSLQAYAANQPVQAIELLARGVAVGLASAIVRGLAGSDQGLPENAWVILLSRFDSMVQPGSGEGARAVASLAVRGDLTKEVSDHQRRSVFSFLETARTQAQPAPKSEFGDFGLFDAMLSHDRPVLLDAMLALALGFQDPSIIEGAVRTAFSTTVELAERAVIGKHYRALLQRFENLETEARRTLFPAGDQAAVRASLDLLIQSNDHGWLWNALKPEIERFIEQESRCWRQEPSAGFSFVPFYFCLTYRRIFSIEDSQNPLLAALDRQPELRQFLKDAVRRGCCGSWDDEQRLAEIWDGLVPILSSAERAEYFPFWFVFGDLPPEWALNEIDSILDSGSRLSCFPSVLDELEDYTEEFPARVAVTARRHIESWLDHDPTKLARYGDTVRRILRALPDVGEAREAGDRLKAVALRSGLRAEFLS